MAIGTLAALAIGAATVGGAAISAGASNKAANAATQAADTSAAVQREQLTAAKNALNPYAQAGLPATGAINSLLGLTPTQSYGQPQYGPQQLAQGYDTGQQTGYQTPYNISTDGVQGIDPWNTGQVPWTYGQGLDPNGSGAMSLTTQPSAQSGFDQFRNSTGYQFRLGEGMRALNSGFAGSGMLQSGAAAKSALSLGQNMASQEFNNYLGALGNQQAMGLSAGSALAGVGQNYANSLTQINNNKADAIGNSALLNARNVNGLLGSVAGGILKYG